MARALFVRPRIFVRFVWGRTKQIGSRLEKQNSRILTSFPHGYLSRSKSGFSSAYRVGMAGQLTALCCFISALNDHAPGVTTAQAADTVGQLNAVAASAAPVDLTSILGTLAILLLMGSNVHLLRRRHLTDEINSRQPMTVAPEVTNADVYGIPDLSVPEKNDAGPCFELERQCQKLADIADRSQHARSRVEAVNRARIARLASISHELRTPLNAVIGFSDLMRRELFGPLGHSKYQEYAEHIGDSGHDLLNAVDDIFALTSEDLDRPAAIESDDAKVRNPSYCAGLVSASLKREFEVAD